MRASMVCVALICCLGLTAAALAQDDEVPVPPERERPVGDVPLEQGPKVRAEEPAKPADVAAPDEPTTSTATKVREPEPVPDSTATETPEVRETVTNVTPEVVAPKTVPEEPVKPAAGDDEEIPELPRAMRTDVDVSTMKRTPDVTKPYEMQVPPTMSVSSNMSEVELVENVAVAREAYRLALEALKTHYVDTHNATKLAWAEKELKELNAVDKYHYLDEAELAGPALKPASSISAADQLFAEGIEFKNYPAFPEEKRGKLKTALLKFRTIISDYPTSDKIDDAAFRMGEIYEGWYYEDYARAVVCFERCFQWNPRTPFPARFKAAQIYDKKLMQRDKAVELYNAVVRDSQNTDHVDEARRRLNELSAMRR